MAQSPLKYWKWLIFTHSGFNSKTSEPIKRIDLISDFLALFWVSPRPPKHSSWSNSFSLRYQQNRDQQKFLVISPLPLYKENNQCRKWTFARVHILYKRIYILAIKAFMGFKSFPEWDKMQFLYKTLFSYWHSTFKIYSQILIWTAHRRHSPPWNTENDLFSLIVDSTVKHQNP